MKRKGLNIFIVFAAVMALNFSCSSVPQNFNSADEMVEAIKATVSHIEVAEFKTLLDAGENFFLIDVREPNEFNSGFIPGAINIARGVLEFRIAKESFWEEEMLYMPEKEDLIIICCKKGHRGTLGADALVKLGYTNVKNLDGGFKNWASEYPDLVEKNETATAGMSMEGMTSGVDDDGGC